MPRLCAARGPLAKKPTAKLSTEHIDTGPSASPTGSIAERATTKELYRFLVESTTEYAIFAIALDGTIAMWNVGAEHAFGYESAEILGRPYDTIFSPEDVADGAPARELSLARTEGRADCDRWHVRKDGTRFWGTNTVQPLLNASGAIAGYTKIVRDISERHRALSALHDSEERMRVLLESVEDYAILSLSSTGLIQTWNAGAERLFGYSAGEAIGEYFSLLYSRQDAAAGVPEMELREASLQSNCIDERWHVRKDGSRFFATGKLSCVRASHAQHIDFGYVKVSHDITERKEKEDAMRHEAFHDGLTALPNRSLFLEHLRRSIAQARRSNEVSYAVLFLDLDNFKLLNDTLGHVLADRVLIAFSQRLSGLLRAEDVVARLGGDEFGLLIGDLAEPAEALVVANRLRAALANPFLIEGREVFTSASIGVAFGSAHYEKPEDVLRDADIAMYAAKLQGRSGTVLFDTAMYRNVIARHKLEGELRTAVRNEELRTVYQPIFALESSQMVGFEALVRWDHPSRGRLQPSEFISIAEDSGSIIEIDRWVLRRACRDLSAWKSEGDGSAALYLSVNVSSRQFSDPLLVERIRDVLDDTGFAASQLKLEITENSLLESSSNVADNLNALRKLGVEMYVDDFGTGYSSLTYLRDLPISALKVDRSFVADMLKDTGSAEIVRSVVTLAHNFGLTAIAEGVESAEQLDALRALNCDCAQGFLFSKPLGWHSASALACSAASGTIEAAPSGSNGRFESTNR